MEYNCILVNNDVREYCISRKDTSLITRFDSVLLITFICSILKHQFYNQSLFKSFSTYFLILLILFRIYLKFFLVKQESLIVMREIGVQLKKKYFLRPSTIEFIEKNKIEQIIINEGITKHNVIFYMAFIVEGKNKMVLAFEDLIPRINILLKIYKDTMSFIYSNNIIVNNNQPQPQQPQQQQQPIQQPIQQQSQQHSNLTTTPIISNLDDSEDLK